VKPILFVAFADPEDVPGATLPSLRAEEANIRLSLRDVCALGSWEYASGLECTRKQLVEAFNSDRVAVFHFGGHASPQSLLLPAEESGNQIVNGLLVEDFLAQQKNLKLAFFNACSTERWAAKLAENIPYVVATVCSVPDRMALDFASVFYASLAADNTIEEAFTKAKAAVVLQHEELKAAPPPRETDAVLGRTEFRRMDTEDDAAAGQTFPWILCKNGCVTPDDGRWTFSVGAHDPLIGLPLLAPAEYTLPDRPYVTIKGHTEAEAPLFFGRNAEIRALYDWTLKKDDGPPVLLFHGQSGAGKSSLLNAGLLPRLKKKRGVEYRRRGVNLVDDLHAALGGDTDAVIDAWLAADAPRLIILDQVEEAITHNAGSAEELRAFVERVKQVFARRGAASKARMVLSFRKEYLAEIQGLFAKGDAEDAAPLVETFWLDRLDCDGIVEVVEGPTLKAELQAKYRIRLENGFADFVASRLDDPNSPIAAILQIVLNQLWDKAKEQGGDPVYTRELWGKLSALDNPLHGFYGEQMERVFAEGSEAYRAGLELDLLLEHTTELGSSQRRTLQELIEKYPQIAAAELEALIRKNKELYLLADPAQEAGEGAAGGSVLAHDTLAPVIRRDFVLSLGAGARARRLVQNRAREWVGGKTGGPLDAFDLRVVSKGLKQMRALESDEQRMLEFSRKRALRNLTILVSVLVLLVGSGSFAGWKWWQAKQTAAVNARRAQEQHEIAERNAERARNEERIKTALRLAGEARDEATSRYDLAILLSIAAYKTDNSRFEVRDAITSVFEARPEAIAFLHAKNPRTYVWGGMAYSADGRLLAATSSNQAEVWDVRRKTRMWSVTTAKDPQSAQPYIAFSQDGNWLALADYNTVQVRNAQSGALVLRALRGAPDKVSAIAFGGSSLVAGGCSVAQVWRMKDWKPLATLPAKDPGCQQEDQLTNVAVNPRNEQEIAMRWFHGKVTVGTTVLRASDETKRDGADEGNYWLGYSADGKRLVATTRWGGLEVFDLAARRSMGVIPAKSEKRFTGVGLNADGSRLVAMLDGALGQWDTGSMAPLRPLLEGRWAALDEAVASPDFKTVAMRGLDGDLVLLDNAWGVGGVLPLSPDDLSQVTDAGPVAFSPDGNWIATGTADGDVYLWDATTRKVVRTFAAADGEKFMVESVAFSPDSRILAWPVAGSVQRRRIGVHAVQVQGGHSLPDFVSAPDKNERGIQGMSFAPDGRVVGISDQGVLRIWDAKKHEAPMVLRGKASGGFSLGVAVSADGKYLATPGTNGRVVTVLNMQNGEPVEPPIDLGGMWAYTVAMDPAAHEGKETLLAEGHPYGFSIWDYMTGKPAGSADMGNTVVRSAKFSPDGRRVAVGMDNGALRMWDVTAGRWIGDDVVRAGDAGTNFGPRVAFSPDGKRMVWGGPHGSLREWDWDIDPEKWVKRGCALVGRNMTQQEWQLHYPHKEYEKLCLDLPEDSGVPVAAWEMREHGKSKDKDVAGTHEGGERKDIAKHEPKHKKDKHA
jgi:WD40 repeat protein